MKLLTFSMQQWQYSYNESLIYFDIDRNSSQTNIKSSLIWLKCKIHSLYNSSFASKTHLQWQINLGVLLKTELSMFLAFIVLLPLTFNWMEAFLTTILTNCKTWFLLATLCSWCPLCFNNYSWLKHLLSSNCVELMWLHTQFCFAFAKLISKWMLLFVWEKLDNMMNGCHEWGTKCCSCMNTSLL